MTHPIRAGGTVRGPGIRLVEMYLRGDLKLDQMISGRLKLEQINDAMDDLKAGEVARNVIAF